MSCLFRNHISFLFDVFLIVFTVISSTVLSAFDDTFAQIPPDPQAGYWEDTYSFSYKLSFEVTEDGKIRDFYFDYDAAGVTCRIEILDDIPVEEAKFEARLFSNGNPEAGIWGEFTSDTSAEGSLICLKNGQTAMWKADWQYSLTSSTDTTAEATVQPTPSSPANTATVTPVPFSTSTLAPQPINVQDGFGKQPITAENASRVEAGAVLENPVEAVFSAVTVSPDGNLIAAGDEEGNVYIWNVADLSLVSTITVPTYVRDLAFSADRSGIVLSYWDWEDETGATVFIDPLTGEEKFRLDYDGRVSTIAFSSDGAQILTATNNVYSEGGDKLLLWDAATGTALGGLEEFWAWPYNRAVFSPDGTYIASVGTDSVGNMLQVWNQEATTMSRFNLYESPLLAGDSPMPGSWSGGSLVVDNNRDVWTNIFFIVSLNRRQVEFVYMMTDGREDVLEDDINIEDGAFAVPFTGLDEEASFQCKFQSQTEANCTLISGSIHIDNDVDHSLPDFWSVAFSPDSSQIAISVEDGTIQVWDVSEEAVTQPLGEAYANSGVRDVVYGIDGTVLVSLNQDGKLRFWNPLTRSIINELEGHEFGTRLAISADGRIVASAGQSSDKGEVRLWGVPTTIPSDSSSAPIVSPQPMNTVTATTAPSATPSATSQPTNTATAPPTPSSTSSPTPVAVGAGTYITGDTPEEMMRSLVQVGLIPATSGFLVEEEQIFIDLSGQPAQFSWDFMDDQYYGNFVISGDIIWGPGDGEDSCGFGLRMKNVSDFYAIFLNQDRLLWFQEYFNDTWQEPVVGEASTFHVGPNRQNRLLVIALDEAITVFLNGEYAGQFQDDSRKSGWAAALMTTYGASERTYCTFQNLWVWDLTARASQPTRTPTATPVAAGYAVGGSNPGVVPSGGSQSWLYAGQAGEILTIRVKADHPANSALERTGLLDTLLVVRDPLGAIIAQSDDIVPGQVTDSLIADLTLQATGDYQIEISSWDSGTDGGYTLIIESCIEAQ